MMSNDNFYFQVKTDGTVNVQTTCDNLMTYVHDPRNPLYITYAQRALLTAIISRIANTMPKENWKVETLLKHLKNYEYLDYKDMDKLTEANMAIVKHLSDNEQFKVGLYCFVPIAYLHVNYGPESIVVKITERKQEDEISAG